MFVIMYRCVCCVSASKAGSTVVVHAALTLTRHTPAGKLPGEIGLMMLCWHGSLLKAPAAVPDQDAELTGMVFLS